MNNMRLIRKQMASAINRSIAKRIMYNRPLLSGGCFPAQSHARLRKFDVSLQHSISAPVGESVRLVAAQSERR